MIVPRVRRKRQASGLLPSVTQRLLVLANHTRENNDAPVRTIQAAPADPILGLSEAFKADPNPKKINLSVGVYQDASGKTPVLESIKRAAQKVVEKQASKSYLPIPGSPAYAAAVQKLMFGADHEAVTSGRVATSHTPGGTGALRVAADLIHQQHAQGDGLDDAADLAESSADFRRGRRADEDRAVLRRQDERPGLGRVHRRREADPRGRRAACSTPAATTRPASTPRRSSGRSWPT